MNAEDFIKILEDQGADTFEKKINCLQDGEFLASLNFYVKQDVVDDAHNIVIKEINNKRSIFGTQIMDDFYDIVEAGEDIIKKRRGNL